MYSIRTVANRKADQFAVPVQSQQGQTAHKVYLFSFNQITITSRNSREAFVVKTSRLCIKAALTSRQFRFSLGQSVIKSLRCQVSVTPSGKNTMLSVFLASVMSGVCFTLLLAMLKSMIYPTFHIFPSFWTGKYLVL